MLTVYLTNDTDMGAPKNDPVEMTRDQVVSYLNQDPRHAVIVIVCGPSDDQVAVFRGASDQPNNFYVQVLPLEEPDADGGDWTASEALDEALDTVA